MNLTLPYISETTSHEIRKFIRRKSLPIQPIFTPGTRLRDILCNSRPHDQPKCSKKDCKICSALEKGTCTTMAPVYQITCKICGEFYVGETCRSANERLSEHLRYSGNPTAASYRDEAWAQHYREKHRGGKPELSFKILTTERNTLQRKIVEAMYIQKLKPTINNKEECAELTRFLV